MRDIIFRLIKNGKIVGYETHFTDPDLGLMCVYHKGVGETKLKVGCPLTMGDKAYIPHTEKEQYTGLCDKNGKRIFEGDIVVSQYTGKSVVKFGIHETCQPDYYSSLAYGWFFENDNTCPETFTIWDNYDICEVIGNIHDTKE